MWHLREQWNRIESIVNQTVIWTMLSLECFPNAWARLVVVVEGERFHVNQHLLQAGILVFQEVLLLLVKGGRGRGAYWQKLQKESLSANISRNLPNGKKMHNVTETHRLVKWFVFSFVPCSTSPYCPYPSFPCLLLFCLPCAQSPFPYVLVGYIPNWGEKVKMFTYFTFLSVKFIEN